MRHLRRKYFDKVKVLQWKKRGKTKYWNWMNLFVEGKKRDSVSSTGSSKWKVFNDCFWPQMKGRIIFFHVCFQMIRTWYLISVFFRLKGNNSNKEKLNLLLEGRLQKWRRPVICHLFQWILCLMVKRSWVSTFLLLDLKRF